VAHSACGPRTRANEDVHGACACDAKHADRQRSNVGKAARSHPRVAGSISLIQRRSATTSRTTRGCSSITCATNNEQTRLSEQKCCTQAPGRAEHSPSPTRGWEKAPQQQRRDRLRRSPRSWALLGARSPLAPSHGEGPAVLATSVPVRFVSVPAHFISVLAHRCKPEHRAHRRGRGTSDRSLSESLLAMSPATDSASVSRESICRCSCVRSRRSL
jgi:hypothetical protein